MAKNTQFRLNTGAHIPAVGFGTWQDAGQQEQAVQDSVNVGYRHIDTAAVYGTEPAIGRALKKSGVPRDQLFITSKLWNNMHHPDDVAKGLDISLKDLGTDYLDLYLMHWPVAFARGDNKFPKTAEGKTATIPVDYVDVHMCPIITSRIRGYANQVPDIQGDGETSPDREGQGNWHIQLFPS